MADITHADLLAMQTVITETVRHEVGQAKQEIAALADEVAIQNTRVNRLEIRQRDHGTKLRQVQQGSLLGSLSRKQKALLVTASGAVAAAIPQLLSALSSWLMKGVRP